MSEMPLWFTPICMITQQTQPNSLTLIQANRGNCPPHTVMINVITSQVQDLIHLQKSLIYSRSFVSQYKSPLLTCDKGDSRHTLA